MITENLRNRLIVALDLPSVNDARNLVEVLGDSVSFYKIGYRLAFTGGVDFGRDLIEAGKKVFLDLKLHDIGTTVEEGVRAIAHSGFSFLTIHAYPQTMRAAVSGRGNEALRLLAVTVLTSYNDNDLTEAGYALPVTGLVARRAVQARNIGVDGLVCAAEEASVARSLLGQGRLIVTPGIRPAGVSANDQKRVMTPAAALKAGVDHLVVGRPITHAPDPRGAALAILDEMATIH